MVDVVSAISAAASVQAPAIIDFTDSQHRSMRSAPGLGVGDLLSCVFGDLASSFERYGGEAAFAMYRRRLDY